MTLWIIFAVMTAVAALAVLVPVARARRTTAAETADVAVYRDQLAELDRDAARGVVAAGEALAARTEIVRRLLKAAREAEAPAAAAPGRGRLAGVVAVLVVPAVAVGVYLAVGAPDLPDQPLAPRLAAAPGSQSVDQLIARTEAHLAAKPEDGQGWDVIAPVYLRLRRPDDAAAAYRNAIRLLGSSARRQFGLGQALTIAAGEVVTSEARVAFEAAAALDPTLAPARMYLAVALSQEGRHADAAAAWAAIVDAAKGDEPWLEIARRERAEAEQRAGLPSTPPPAAGSPGPSAGDVAAAEQLAPAERAKMVEAMVARLAERLDAGGGSVEDWTRLIRSLVVLGRSDDAVKAVRKAREALAADEAGRTRIDEAAKGLGLVP